MSDVKALFGLIDKKNKRRLIGRGDLLRPVCFVRHPALFGRLGHCDLFSE